MKERTGWYIERTWDMWDEGFGSFGFSISWERGRLYCLRVDVFKAAFEIGWDKP